LGEFLDIDDPEGKFPVKSARELHEELEVGRAFATWSKSRITRLLFVEGEDFVVYAKSGVNPQGDRPGVDYVCSLMRDKRLCMGDGDDRAKGLTVYFGQCVNHFSEQLPDSRQICASGAFLLMSRHNRRSD
jgi:anti-repressor protein